MARKINQAGIDLVKTFEGFRSKAYLCPAGVPTIGYGHTNGVQMGDTVTLDEAEDLLAEELKKFGESVSELITVGLSANQFAALTSFTYNVGATNLKASTLRKKLNKGDYDSVPSEMARWNKATDPKTGQKVVLEGLVRRRAAEAELWLAKDKRKLVHTAGMPQEVSE